MVTHPIGDNMFRNRVKFLTMAYYLRAFMILVYATDSISDSGK